MYSMNGCLCPVGYCAQAVMTQASRRALADKTQALKVCGKHLKPGGDWDTHDAPTLLDCHRTWSRSGRTQPPEGALARRVRRRRTRKERSLARRSRALGLEDRPHCRPRPPQPHRDRRGGRGHACACCRSCRGPPPRETVFARTLPRRDPLVITEHRLIGHRGLFNREVKSLDIDRLLATGERTEGSGDPHSAPLSASPSLEPPPVDAPPRDALAEAEGVGTPGSRHQEAPCRPTGDRGLCGSQERDAVHPDSAAARPQAGTSRGSRAEPGDSESEAPPDPGGDPGAGNEARTELSCRLDPLQSHGTAGRVECCPSTPEAQSGETGARHQTALAAPTKAQSCDCQSRSDPLARESRLHAAMEAGVSGATPEERNPISALALQLCQGLDLRPLQQGGSLLQEQREGLQRLLWQHHGQRLDLHLLAVRRRLSYADSSSEPLAGSSGTKPDLHPTRPDPASSRKRRRKQDVPKKVETLPFLAEASQQGPAYSEDRDTAVPWSRSGSPVQTRGSSAGPLPDPDTASSPIFFSDFTPSPPFLLFPAGDSAAPEGLGGPSEQAEGSTRGAGGHFGAPERRSPQHRARRSSIRQAYGAPCPLSPALPLGGAPGRGDTAAQWLDRGGCLPAGARRHHSRQKPLPRIESLHLQADPPPSQHPMSPPHPPARPHHRSMPYHPSCSLLGRPLYPTFLPTPSLELSLSPEPWSFPRMKLY
ncbi:proline-rich protein 19 isoform X1 [Lepisosteus oculatus]|uniref:proline-rich protein 19 isoform X1 n=2 Tax=Lepisosteus oculatus TaxID=7918 RepID=UPI00371C3AFA